LASLLRNSASCASIVATASAGVARLGRIERRTHGAQVCRQHRPRPPRRAGAAADRAILPTIAEVHGSEAPMLVLRGAVCLDWCAAIVESIEQPRDVGRAMRR
jgi:hypothetical protein